MSTPPATPAPDSPAPASVMQGCEPMSHTGALRSGALVLHGFTGNPSSMRSVAEALAAAGHHVELPRLPGHGTVVEDMLPTRWGDWTDEVAAAYDRLAERTDEIIVVGLSMGGSLTLWTGFNRPVAGLVCINPATQPQADEVVAMLDEMLGAGTEVMPGIGSDIADPDVDEIAYDGTPIAPLISLVQDGLAPMTDRYGELTAPLLLITSRQDHVVEPTQSEHLAATYGGDVEHVWLERSYHVATQDYDRDDIIARVLAFANDLAG